MSTYRRIPESAGPGRLGRHVNHDPRSLSFRVGQPARALVSVLHERLVPVFDQGDLGSCHDGLTEVLTESGWKLFRDALPTDKLATVNPDSGDLIFELPTRLVAFEYDGDMYSANRTGLNFAVTGDHSMVVRKWNEKARTLNEHYEFVPMADLGWYAGIPAVVNYAGTNDSDFYALPGVDHKTRPGQRADLAMPMDTWLKFLGIYLAEGTMCPGSNDPYKIQIAAVKEREKVFVRELLVDMGVIALELKDRFTFGNKRVFTELTRLGLLGVKAPHKFVPEFVFELSADHIDKLVLGHFMGDGCEQDGLTSHYTSSVRLADDLQRLLFLSGRRTSLTVRVPRQNGIIEGRVVKGRHPEHRVCSYNKQQLSIERKKDITKYHYTGMVYCAEVPSFHTLVTRRNGAILISGNCTGNASVGALGTAPLYAALPAAHLTLNEDLAVQVYGDATRLDSFDGSYPPDDTGSDGLSAAKALKAHGLIAGYLHATDLTTMQAALQDTPVIVGVNWYAGFDRPDAGGHVKISGAIRGGHEFEVIGMDVVAQTFTAVNSWGPGWGVNGRFTFSFADMTRLLKEDGDCTQLLPLTAPVPTPTPPAPGDADVTAWWVATKSWANSSHVGTNKTAARAALTLAKAKGLT